MQACHFMWVSQLYMICMITSIASLVLCCHLCCCWLKLVTSLWQQWLFQYCYLLYTASFQLPWQLFPYLTSWLVVLLQCIQYVCTLHAHTPPPLTPLVHLTEVDVVGLLDKWFTFLCPVYTTLPLLASFGISVRFPCSAVNPSYVTVSNLALFSFFLLSKVMFYIVCAP